LRECAEHDRAGVLRSAHQRVANFDGVPRGRREYLVARIAGRVDIHAHEARRELGVGLNEIGGDAIARGATQHFVAEAVASDAAHHGHGRAGCAKVARDVERRTAEEESFGKCIPEDFADTENFGLCHFPFGIWNCNLRQRAQVTATGAGGHPRDWAIHQATCLGEYAPA
jgi:hypothetical protein